MTDATTINNTNATDGTITATSTALFREDIYVVISLLLAALQAKGSPAERLLSADTLLLRAVNVLTSSLQQIDNSDVTTL